MATRKRSKYIIPGKMGALFLGLGKKKQEFVGLFPDLNGAHALAHAIGRIDYYVTPLTYKETESLFKKYAK